MLRANRKRHLLCAGCGCRSWVRGELGQMQAPPVPSASSRQQCAKCAAARSSPAVGRQLGTLCQTVCPLRLPSPHSCVELDLLQPLHFPGWRPPPHPLPDAQMLQVQPRGCSTPSDWPPGLCLPACVPRCWCLDWTHEKRSCPLRLPLCFPGSPG